MARRLDKIESSINRVMIEVERNMGNLEEEEQRELGWQIIFDLLRDFDENDKVYILNKLGLKENKNGKA
jgi:hypothetical protein